MNRAESLRFKPILGLLPIGRGNDFAYTANVSAKVPLALHSLLEPALIPLDVGFVKGGFFPNGRFFVNGVGIGFDTLVGFEAAKMKIQGGITYAVGALKVVAKFEKAPLIEAQYDDKQFTTRTALVSLMNGRRMGGVFFMGPHAELNDGKLDICAVEQRSRLKLVGVIANYTKGTQEKCGGVSMDRGERFHLVAREGGMAAHCDGETVCTCGTELDVHCIPQPLRLATSIA
jgi:diacylglycerol kinase family enzyme